MFPPQKPQRPHLHKPEESGQSEGSEAARVREFLKVLKQHTPVQRETTLKTDSEIFAAMREEIDSDPALFEALNTLFPDTAEALDIVVEAHIPWDLNERARRISEGEGYPPVGRGSSVRGSAITPVAFVEAAKSFVLDGSTTERPAPFLHYFPDHTMLTEEQRITYVEWKTQALSGNFMPVPDTYLFLHVFELINGIGWDDAGECATQLATLWSSYQETSEAVRVQLWDWIEDFLYINHVEDGILQFRAAVTAEWQSAPFTDAQIDFYVEGDQLFRIPIELMEAIARVDLDEFESVKQDAAFTFFDTLPLTLNAVDFVIKLTAPNSGFFQKYGPRGKHRPERLAFAGAPYTGKPAMVRLPPVASYFEHPGLRERMRSFIEHVDYFVCVHLGLDTSAYEGFEEDPDFRHVSASVEDFIRSSGITAAGSLPPDMDDLEADFLVDGEPGAPGSMPPPIPLFPSAPVFAESALPFFEDDDEDDDDDFDFSDVDIAEADAANWEIFWEGLSQIEQRCLQNMITNIFPLSRLRTIAREANESLNHILNGLNRKSMEYYGEHIVYTGNKQPVVMPSFLAELHTTLHPEVPQPPT